MRHTTGYYIPLKYTLKMLIASPTSFNILKTLPDAMLIEKSPLKSSQSNIKGIVHNDFILPPSVADHCKTLRQ